VHQTGLRRRLEHEYLGDLRGEREGEREKSERKGGEREKW
jgi:hypothetical protein